VLGEIRKKTKEIHEKEENKEETFGGKKGPS